MASIKTIEKTDEMSAKKIKSEPAASNRPKSEKPEKEKWILRLYVAGPTPKSLTAFKNLKSICEEQLKGKFQIEVIDLLKNPQLGQDDQILALPTLVRKLPVPVRKIIGDLSDSERVLVGLDLKRPVF